MNLHTPAARKAGSVDRRQNPAPGRTLPWLDDLDDLPVHRRHTVHPNVERMRYPTGAGTCSLDLNPIYSGNGKVAQGYRSFKTQYIHPNAFSVPTTFGSNLFGVITGAQANPRGFQFAGHLNF